MTINRALYFKADGTLGGGGTDQDPYVVPVGQKNLVDDEFAPLPAQTRWSGSDTNGYSSLGPGFVKFEAEIVNAAVVDQAAIVTRYVNLHRSRTENLTAAEITAYRTKLQGFVTTYNARFP